MTTHDYKVLDKANAQYNAMLEKDGFTSEAENLLYTMVEYCLERGISSAEFNKYFN